MLTGERVEHEAPRASGQLSLPIDRAWGGRERVPCERENRRERWRMRACVEQWRGRQGSRTGSRGCHCNKARAPRLFGSIVPCDATERIVSQPPPERVRRVTFELLEVMLAAVRGQRLQHINWRSRAGVDDHRAIIGRCTYSLPWAGVLSWGPGQGGGRSGCRAAACLWPWPRPWPTDRELSKSLWPVNERCCPGQQANATFSGRRVKSRFALVLSISCAADRTSQQVRNLRCATFLFLLAYVVRYGICPRRM